MTTWSVGEVVNTLGSHPSIQGFEPPTDYHFFMRIKKESQAFFLKCYICIKKMAGVTGFEPVKWQIQSLLPYRLAIPQKNGWGNWIRTSEMADSESAALPLGYTPTAIYIIHIF